MKFQGMMEPRFNMLIVDEEALALTLRSILEREGYGCASAGDGRTALALCSEQAFDLAIIDVRLRDVMGMALIEKLTVLSPEMEYIVTTVQASLDTAIEAVKQKNIIAYEAKPLDIDNLLALIKQVTERKRAEKALVKSETRYRNLVENAAAGVAIVDLERKFVYFNEALRQMIGYEEAEILGKPFANFIHPDDRKTMLRQMRRAVTKPHDKLELECRVIHKKGHIVHLYFSPTALRYEDEAVGFSAIITDITERKRAEYDLSKRIKELRCLYSVSNITETAGSASGELYREVATLLPPGWQYSEIACARIAVNGDEFRTENYRDTGWKQSAEISINGEKAGIVEVGYFAARPEADEGPFLKEERLLIDAVAERLGIYSESMQAEEALRRSEASLVEAQRIAHLGNWEWDIVNNVLLWSDEIYRIFGLEPQQFEATYEAFIKVVHPGDREFLKKSVDAALCGGKHYSIDHRIVLPDGSEQVVHEKAEVTFDEADKPIRMVGTVHNITERKQAEELLKIISDSSPIGIYIAQDGKFQYINPQMEKSMGYSEEELLGNDSLSYVFPDDRAVVRTGAVLMLKERLPHPYEYRIINKAGEIRWVMETVTSIQYQGRRATLGNYMDITERKQVEQKIIEYEELNKLKTDLLATVSHELRTPLATIKGYATMLLDYDQRLHDKEKLGYLQSIDRATDRLSELVEHLLDMSRMDAGLLRLDKSPTHIFELIKGAVMEGKLRAPKHNIVMQVRKNGLPQAVVDARRIRQVLDNLIDNACKYSEAGTEVMVSARQVGKQLLISVADLGTGIPAAEVDRIFDRMYRIEERLTTKVGGMGLGLAICRGLVEAHGGRIWMVSEWGEGSKCSFTLPL